MFRTTSAERRAKLRRRALKSGKIAFNRRASIIDCVVRDLSVHGARLQVATTVGLPKAFDLIFNGDNNIQLCRVTWLSYQHVGVQFVTCAPEVVVG
jgi:hypothetical protein